MPWWEAPSAGPGEAKKTREGCVWSGAQRGSEASRGPAGGCRAAGGAGAVIPALHLPQAGPEGKMTPRGQGRGKEPPRCQLTQVCHTKVVGKPPQQTEGAGPCPSRLRYPSPLRASLPSWNSQSGLTFTARERPGKATFPEIIESKTHRKQPIRKGVSGS